MFDVGILLHALPFPIVPHGEACLRIRLNSEMTHMDLDELAKAINDNLKWFRGSKQTAAFTPAVPPKLDYSRSTVATDFGDVVVHRKGSGGPALVFLHPLLFGSEIYTDAFRMLPNRFALIAIDWWGHGCSPPLERPISLEQMTVCLKQILEKFVPQVQTVAVIGTSMGGMIALRLAITHPQLVDRLVIIGASADEEEGHAKRLFRSLAQQAGSLGGAAVVNDVLSVMFSANFRDAQPERVSGLAANLTTRPSGHFTPCVNAVLDRHSIRQTLKTITAKTTVIVGDEDIAEPPAHSQIIAELIPNAKLIVTPNCGHLLPVEKPEVLVNALMGNA